VEREVSFFSAGHRLMADLYTPDDVPRGERRPGVVLCCGYTGVKSLYLDEMARRLAQGGYVALTFDYKGWGRSEGPPLRLAPYGRVEDTRAALTFLAQQPAVDPERLGLYGISYGGSTAVFTAAIDSRAKVVVSVTGVGNGGRWMRSVRRPWEYRELVERASAEISARARASATGAAMQVPLEMVHETLGFNPEWVVGRIAPRASLFITSDLDELVPPEESASLLAHAGEPKKLVVLRGFGHYEVFIPPALDEVMKETLDWFGRYL
jgi:fermentation-respiration switch protein FrsA (DUF1100 family)